MKFALRDPNAAYLDNWLWLPKKYWSVTQLRGALQYFDARKNEVFEVFTEAAHHYKVPRNFLHWGTFSSLPYPVYDVRYMDFPKVRFNSKVILDSREPGKDYQRKGSQALLANYDSILSLRCGAGKTVTALDTIAAVSNPALVIVGDKGLARQWMEEIEEWLGIPQNEIGRIGGDGSPFDWEHPITVGIINTLALRAISGKLPPEMLRHFGVVVGDEVHIAGAPLFNAAIPPFHGRRWGLSATPVREDEYDSLLQYTFGSVSYSYLLPDLVPTVYFRKLMTFLDMTNPEVVDRVVDKTKALHLGKLYDYFSTLESRTTKIAADVQKAVDEGRQVLVLTHSRGMCDALAKHLPTAGVCHGGVKEGERLRRIKEMNPVIAIVQLGKQALNKPKLDSLFVCEPFKKEGILQQAMGRILRPFEGKKAPVVVFYEDCNIEPLYRICNKIRAALSRWPEHKGGRIKYFNK